MVLLDELAVLPQHSPGKPDAHKRLTGSQSQVIRAPWPGQPAWQPASPAPTSQAQVMRGAATPARGQAQAPLSRRHEDLAELAAQPPAMARPLPVRDVDLRHGRNPRGQLAQIARKPSPRSGAQGQPLSISFAL